MHDTHDTYDIIEWKSCLSVSSVAANNSSCGDDDKKFRRPTMRNQNPFLSDDLVSGDDTFVFPKLFHEEARGSETSIVTMETVDNPLFDNLFVTERSDVLTEEEQSVYQKVASWVHTQRRYFRNTEDVPIDDDELEVINPVDLFHESVLTDYWVITDNDIEKRALLRDFGSHRHHIQSIEEGTHTNEYKFLREPQDQVEMELTPIIDFNLKQKMKRSKKKKRKRKRHKDSQASSASSYVELYEENIEFLGVPRLLENYVVLNRDGYDVDCKNQDDHMWLNPVDENQTGREKDEVDNLELDFLSSWFSEVYQDFLNDFDDRHTCLTANTTTDFLERVTVISVYDSDDEVWEDAPDIPHWFDDENQALELFNQPSKPLYYYRDRIKGCYRIIGVEDETVVLFSGNDDDTIFYPGGDCWERMDSRKSSSDTNLPRHKKRLLTNDPNKTDSGIEDDDEVTDLSTINLAVFNSHRKSTPKASNNAQSALTPPTLTNEKSWLEWALLLAVLLTAIALSQLYTYRREIVSIGYINMYDK